MKICTKCAISKCLEDFYPLRGDCKDCSKARMREDGKRRYKQNPDKIKATIAKVPLEKKSTYVYNSLLRKKYGISPEDYARMLQAQNGACAICLEPPTDHKRLCVDHNHTTGKVRGLLCTPCNLSIIKEDVQALLRAVDYLIKYN